jgi:NAD-dependent protein deacetylase/lipoamidase
VLSAINEAAHLLRQSTHAVALTGAGVSTRSGIPDFRSMRSGLWNRTDPLEVASIWTFYNRPDVFYRWMRPLAQKIVAAEPNPAHRALAELERRGCLQTVITQNVDALHQRAGSQHVLELHGRAGSASCLHCSYQTSSAALWADVLKGQHPAPCPQCGGALKPDVILYGEPLPYEALSGAQQEALACDAMLVAGTSLEVMPAADLPLLAKRRGARLILVNLNPTPLDDAMDVVIRADVSKALAQLARATLS